MQLDHGCQAQKLMNTSSIKQVSYLAVPSLYSLYLPASCLVPMFVVSCLSAVPPQPAMFMVSGPCWEILSYNNSQTGSIDRT